MKISIKILLMLFCIGCSNPNTEKIEFEPNLEYATNLLEANVSRITERLQVMIADEGSHHESRKLITDNVYGYIQTWIIYGENGKAILIYKGGSEGFISYSLHPKEMYLSFEEKERKYECKIDRDKNYIIDIAEPKPGRHERGKIDVVTDTIKDFIIIPKDKIILSKDDYELLQKAPKDEDKMYGKRYILYRYE